MLRKNTNIICSFICLLSFIVYGGDMKAHDNQVKYLKDYREINFAIKSVNLTIDLREDYALVSNEMQIERKDKNIIDNLVLDGENLDLLEVKLDNEILSETDYNVTDKSLTIKVKGDSYNLKITTKILPQTNTSLNGFYQVDSELYLTQCEPMGFRKITYFLDRPDVMTVYTTKIIADKKFPVLLSNGDLIDKGDLDSKRHFATWLDKTKKPSYLFALVIGNLKVLEDSYTTKSGNKVALKIYAPEKNIQDTSYAMDSLKASMKWDENVYGLEYDLNTYMIVGTPKFNSGAMENKGLNIFNNKYILASKDSATDHDFENVRAVIGHEYFHNWTGNRVTLRDWFQLSLKEGLTVFRDQEFTSDEFSRTVKRIDDVSTIRGIQFQEDSGPLSHPVRPDSYIKMDNFYTVTVYDKGAELIRMIKTIIGDINFFKGMSLYIAKNDGKAVTTDDFVESMQEASGVDLSQFKLWYSQSGTPNLDIESDYNKESKTLTLKVKQYSDNNPLHKNNKDFLIPIKTGLIAKASGEPLNFTYNGVEKEEVVLLVNEKNQEFQLHNVKLEPVVSLLRDFSAPVKLNYSYSDDDLLFLLKHDPNEFNKWDAGQKYYTKFLLDSINKKIDDKTIAMNSQKIAKTIAELIKNPQLDKAFISMAIILPSIAELSQLIEQIDPDLVYSSRKKLVKNIAREIHKDLLSCYHKLNNELSLRPYSLTKDDIAARSLKNICLTYLANNDADLAEGLAVEQFNKADNLTDRIAALAIIKDSDNNKLYQKTFNDFFNKWKNDDLILQKWFSLQASSERKDTDLVVKTLLKNPAFDISTPNHIYALIGGYISNYLYFHKKDGSGYKFLADFIIRLDATNPKVAALIVKKFSNYKKLEPVRSKLMKEALLNIKNQVKLSEDTKEMVNMLLN